MGQCAICTYQDQSKKADILVDSSINNKVRINKHSQLHEKSDIINSSLLIKSNQDKSLLKLSRGKTISSFRKIKTFLKVPTLQLNESYSPNKNNKLQKTAEQLLCNYSKNNISLIEKKNQTEKLTFSPPIKFPINLNHFKAKSLNSNDSSMNTTANNENNNNNSNNNSNNLLNNNLNNLININNINLINHFNSGEEVKKFKIEENISVIEEKENEGTINSNYEINNHSELDNQKFSTLKYNNNNVDDKSLQYEEIEITNSQENKVLNMLKNHYLFKHFNENMLKIIIDNSQGFQIEERSVIFKEGDIGESFFIIQNGQVEISSNKTGDKKILGPGEGFGDLALIYHTVKRDSTAIALTKLDFYLILGKSYRETSKNFSKNYIEQNIFFINSNIWFSYLASVDKLNLASLIKYQCFSSNQIVCYTNNDNSNLNEDNINYINYIFLVKNGCFEIKYINKKNNEVETRKLYPKDSIGESQIIMDIHNDNYNYELKSLEDSSAYLINKDILVEGLGKNYKETILFSIFKHCINKNRFFKNILLKSYFKQIFELFEIKNYENGAIIYNSKNLIENKKVIIILEGSLKNKNNTKKILSEKGKLFGDEIINSKENIIKNDIIANGYQLVALECQWIKIRDKLQILSKNSNLDTFKKANKLSKMYIFKHIADSKILELSQHFKKVKFEKNEVIINENEKIDFFYIIIKGTVKITKKGNFVREIEQGNCFGEIYLLNDEISDVSISALNEVQCYTLNKKLFMDFLIDENLNEYIKKKISLEDTNVELNDLFHISFLGKGRFGTVSLVHNQISLYAIKTIPKAFIDSNSQLSKYILEEKKSLLSLDYPLIVKLVKTLKYEKSLCFFLMEYISGKSLDDYINSKIINSKNVEEVKFFGGCMVLALNYLNKKNIIHRDIKPANLIIDNSGYVKLLDFGTSKKIKDFTFTSLGTPTCTAPEVLLGKGYSYPVDYWSIGVCMYFIYYGKYPFGTDKNDIQQIYDDILHKEPLFISEKNNRELNCFLSCMLDKNPVNRLCTLEAFEEHLFYNKFNWEELKQFKMVPPFIPDNKLFKNTSTYLTNTRTPFLPFISQYKFDLIPFHQNTECTLSNNCNNWFDDF